MPEQFKELGQLLCHRFLVVEKSFELLAVTYSLDQAKNLSYGNFMGLRFCIFTSLESYAQVQYE